MPALSGILSQPVTSKHWECLQTGSQKGKTRLQKISVSGHHAKASALANLRSWRTAEKISQSQNLRVRHLEVPPQSQLSSATSGQNPDPHQPIALGEPPNIPMTSHLICHSILLDSIIMIQAEDFLFLDHSWVEKPSSRSDHSIYPWLLWQFEIWVCSFQILIERKVGKWKLKLWQSGFIPVSWGPLW